MKYGNEEESGVDCDISQKIMSQMRAMSHFFTLL